MRNCRMDKNVICGLRAYTQLHSHRQKSTIHVDKTSAVVWFIIVYWADFVKHFAKKPQKNNTHQQPKHHGDLFLHLSSTDKASSQIFAFISIRAFSSLLHGPEPAENRNKLPKQHSRR